jgi:chemotaxis protein CheZ
MSNPKKFKMSDLSSAEDHIANLRSAHGEMMATRDIVEVVESLISTLRVEVDVATSRIGEELRGMIEFIDCAKKEMSSINSGALANLDIPGATDQLDAVVQHTEQAAGQIMDCADDISRLASEVAPEIAARLHAIATRIYEASSFQDITGQRVTKVVRVLKEIEKRLSALADVIGDSFSIAPQDGPHNEAGEHDVERALLNGPQIAGDGNNQSDIDALLASFD